MIRVRQVSDLLRLVRNKDNVISVIVMSDKGGFQLSGDRTIVMRA